MNIWIPFICLAFGTAINWRGLPVGILKAADQIVNIALMALMLVIGLNIGTSDTVLDNIGRIGLNCVIISIVAMWCSVGLTFICEKTVMPLEKIRLQALQEQDATSVPQNNDEKTSSFSPFIIIMPAFIALGILIGIIFFNEKNTAWLDPVLTVSLIFLYTGVGISLASNKSVFGYVKRLGLRILFLPMAIFVGCILGGFICALFLDVPTSWSVISASGMGYYSLTGAYLTEMCGIESGTYGFIINVLRDVLTVCMMPLLSRISKGSPIASGAAGCMDTMLVPVTKAVGSELGLVALISGTILTVVVSVWLPISGNLLGL